MIAAPVFIVGCARSGTSILGEAIAAHPRVAYLFEASEVWNDLFPGRPDHRLTAADAAPAIVAAVHRALADARRGLPGDVLVEKNPKHVLRLSFLNAAFPDAKFLHIVRDPRDVVASLMFRNRGAQWGHLEVPGWRDLLARYPTANHLRCAHQWLAAVTLARGDTAALPPSRYREVGYEKLVERPWPTLREVLELLELPPDEAVKEFAAKIQDQTQGSYHARKQVRHYLENHSRRVGRYRENLTATEVDEVERICEAAGSLPNR